MSDKKQSSVEWLFEKLSSTPQNKFDWYVIFEQAKAMHQKELEDAYDQKVIDGIQNWSIRSGKHYYELHYKKNEN